MISIKSDQNRSDHENQNRYCEANTLSSFSIFYTGKLTSLKRREFFLRAVVMKSTDRYICVVVLLNSGVYIRRAGYVPRPCFYLNILLIAKVLRPYWSGHIAHHGRCYFSSNFKKGLFRSSYFRGFITVKTPEYNLHCKFYMRLKTGTSLHKGD